MSEANRSESGVAPQSPACVELTPEDESRAAVYALLARFLSHAPAADDLAEIGKLTGSDSAFGQAIARLAAAARETNAQACEDAYHDIFIGVARGRLLPYGSYYLTGFLNEKPLARLRNSMAELGIEADPEVKDPEDHIASVLDMMSGLIRGAFVAPPSLETQAAFYRDHVQPWAPHFFRDLEKIEEHKLYAALGSVGRIFLELEEAALAMD